MAAQVGISGPALELDTLRTASPEELERCDVFAGVYPEDKFRLIQVLQQRGRVTGMTWEGVNDVPALKQADVGVAVSTATDVAKAAASLVLTNPGLDGVIAAIETSAFYILGKRRRARHWIFGGWYWVRIPDGR